MADDDNPKSNRRWRRWLTPSMPRIRSDHGLGIREQGRHFTESLRTHAHLCPFDQTEMELTTVFSQDRQGNLIGEGDRAFVCPQCEASLPISAIISDIRQNLDLFKRAERDYFVFAIALIVVFGALWLTTGYLMTLIGGLIFSLLLLLISMTYRYRHWQAVNERLFEKKPPIRDWINDDLLGR